MNPLIAAISHFGNLSEDLLQDIDSRLKYVSYKKKDLVLREGEICNHLFFVTKGLLRSYYYHQEQEVNSMFMEEGDFVISVLSYYKRVPSYEFIEAIEEVELCGFHYDDLNYLYKTYQEFNTIGRQLTESYFCLAEERLKALRFNDAMGKYEFLMNKKTNLINRVPLKDLATYLSITPETLSRMRSSFR